MQKFNHRRNCFLIGALNKKEVFFLLILFITFSAFTVDVLDLRDEIQLGPSHNDNTGVNISTAIPVYPSLAFEAKNEYVCFHQVSSVTVSFIHLLSFSLRAPPVFS
jgi:hypothetical protein